MKRNITLSADEGLIKPARRRAANENKTLNKLFREWLTQYVAQPAASDQYAELMLRLSHVQSGGKLDREEMNERY